MLKIFRGAFGAAKTPFPNFPPPPPRQISLLGIQSYVALRSTKVEIWLLWYLIRLMLRGDFTWINSWWRWAEMHENLSMPFWTVKNWLQREFRSITGLRLQDFGTREVNGDFGLEEHDMENNTVSDNFSKSKILQCTKQVINVNQTFSFMEVLFYIESHCLRFIVGNGQAKSRNCPVICLKHELRFLYSTRKICKIVCVPLFLKFYCTIRISLTFLSSFSRHCKGIWYFKTGLCPNILWCIRLYAVLAFLLQYSHSFHWISMSMLWTDVMITS